MVVVFLLAYTLIVLPLRVGFSSTDVFEHTILKVIELSVDALFILDILITGISAYEDGEGLVTKQSKILTHYIFSLWFPLDLFAGVPFYAIFDSLGEGDENPLIPMKGVKAAKFVKFMRLIRVLKLVRLYRVWPVFEKLEDNPAITREKVQVCKICFVLVSAFHFFACLWVFLGDMNTLQLDPVTPITVDLWPGDNSTGIWKQGASPYDYLLRIDEGITPSTGDVTLDLLEFE